MACASWLLIAGARQNDFVDPAGDDVSLDGDNLVSSGPNEPVTFHLNARDGWSFTDGSTYKEVTVEPGHTNTVTVVGELGEESKEIELQNPWKHMDDPEDEHVQASAIELDHKDRHLLMGYVDPDTGVRVSTNFTASVVSNYLHHSIYSCTVPGCEFGVGKEGNPISGEPAITLKPVTAQLSEGVEIPEDYCTDDGYFLPYGVYTFDYAAEGKGLCDECKCEASAREIYTVAYAALDCPPYLGLDMTDEGKKTNETLRAEVRCLPEGQVQVVRNAWEAGPNSEITKGSETLTTCDCQAKREENTTGKKGALGEKMASNTYKEECVKSVVTLEGAGCENTVNLECTNHFTIVKVDVEIENTFEDEEETDGAFILYCDDRDSSFWTPRGTNYVKSVKFKVWPDSLPSEEEFKITVPGDHLFEKEIVGAVTNFYPAEEVYTKADLEKKQFVLHGHEKATDQELVIQHVASGAIDKAKFHVYDMMLIPDYDRKNGIDDSDEEKVHNQKTFYWWINNDSDKADSANYKADEGTDIPGGDAGNANCKDKVVNKHTDLLDFFPLHLRLDDVRKLLLDPKLPYKLRIKTGQVSFAPLPLDAPRAHEFLVRDFKIPETPWYRSSDHYDTALATNTMIVSETFLRLNENSSYNVLMCEARGNGEPLVLQLVKPVEGQPEPVVKLEVVFRAKFYDVLEMMNQATLNGETYSCEETKLKDPDFATDDVDVFSLHGYKVKAEFAKGWHSEFFKRLYQTGVSPRFTGVTWPGYVQGTGVFDSPGLYYHKCVETAFACRKGFKELVEGVAHKNARTVVMAHSLGNIVVSSAINDEGLRPSAYLMLNAAVASEAYDASKYNPRGKKSQYLVLQEWGDCNDTEKGYPEEAYASYWHNFFPSDSWYSTLTWQDRFKGVITNGVGVVNIMSSEDEVFEICDSSSMNMVKGLKPMQRPSNGKFDWGDLAMIDLDASQYCWQKQELGKGVSSLLNLQHDCDMAGWGFEPIRNKTEKSLMQRLEAALDGENNRLYTKKFARRTVEVDPARFRDMPVFRWNLKNVFQSHTAEESDNLRNKLLANAIPAVSTAMGLTTTVKGIDSIDMADYESGWGRSQWIGNYKERWLHCDIKDMAYFYTHRLWEEVIKERVLGK